MIRAAFVFTAAILTDLVWGRYTLHLVGHRALRAAAYAMLIIGLGVVGITAYVESPWYAVPAALGAGIGTFFAAREKHSGSALLQPQGSEQPHDD